VSDDVMIAVDPHKASNTAALLDPVTKTLIETARFANSDEGYRQLTGFARRWEDRRWAVEGCRGAGRSLAQRLVADGEAVLDVPAKLAARVRVYSKGHGRKTDRDDAVSIGLAALDGCGIAAVARDDVLVSLRLLCDRREELCALRTQAVRPAESFGEVFARRWQALFLEFADLRLIDLCVVAGADAATSIDSASIRTGWLPVR
jgi:transposase